MSVLERVADQFWRFVYSICSVSLYVVAKLCHYTNTYMVANKFSRSLLILHHGSGFDETEELDVICYCVRNSLVAHVHRYPTLRLRLCVYHSSGKDN